MEPEDRLLPKLRGVVPESAGRWKACCPIHAGGNEQHPSLQITKAEDGKLLLHCFVCGPDTRAAQFCLAVGLTQSELYPADAYARGEFPKSKPAGKIVEKYDYIDRDGVLRYQACRLEPKDFRQRRPNGRGGWVWNLREVERILYRLPQLISADPLQPVFIVEGERKADRLAAIGFTATCNVGGAGKWKKSYAEFLAGRDVIILPDNDTPGAEHAAKVTLALADVAKSVRTINLPGLKPKGDIVDYLAAGGTAASLRELCQAGPAGDLLSELPPPIGSTPTPAADDPAAIHFETEILRELQLDVLGEIDGSQGAVKVFSEFHRKSDIIRDVGKLSYERLLQVCGPVVKAKVTKAAESGQLASLTDVKNAISLHSGFRRITDDTELGVGCWQGIDEAGSFDDSILLVGAGEAARWNGHALERITKPRIGGRLLDIGSSEHWYSHDALAAALAGMTPATAEAAVEEAIGFFGRWNWKAKDSPLVVTGLILSTWIQTIWAWRPQVAIVGRSNTGKSTLFEALEGIFGRLAIKSSKSSAAGLRQGIRRSGRVPIVDEFESGKQRDEILEMIRASSRGDMVLKGTAGHKGTSFSLHQIFWVAAIESGLKREADKNRFATLELIPPTEELTGKLVCPPAAVMAELGQRLLFVAVRHGIAARGLAVDLKARRFAGINPRVVESYSVPAAIVATLLGLAGDEAAGILERMLATTDREEGIQADHETLLNDIGASNVDFGKGERGTVSQAIQGRRSIIGSEPALNQVGLEVFDNETIETADGPVTTDWVFIACATVTRKLLRDTTWQSQDISQILSRINNSVKCRKRISGQFLRGVIIPISEMIPEPEQIF